MLKQLDINYYPRYVCNQENRWDGQITNNQFCAGVESGDESHCNGDSGGPAFINTSSGKVQVGIVSFSINGGRCISEIHPAGYTQVSNYIQWIQSNIPGLYIPGSHQWDTIDGAGNRLARLEEHLHSTPLELFTGDTW